MIDQKLSRAPPTMQARPPWPASSASPAEQHASRSRMLLVVPQPVRQPSVGWQYRGASRTVATARRKTEAPNRRGVTMSLATNRTVNRCRTGGPPEVQPQFHLPEAQTESPSVHSAYTPDAHRHQVRWAACCGLARPAGKQYSSKVGLGDSRRSENDSTPRSARQPPCQRRKLVRAVD
jgi:hypothetical protein